MYSGVPTNCGKFVTSVRSVSPPAIAFATPKSITFTAARPSADATRTFDGLRSR
jgi:hypothetical protein